jgi:hypothetical protein
MLMKAAGGRWPWEYSHSTPNSQPNSENPKILAGIPKEQPHQSTPGGSIVDGEPVNIDFTTKNAVRGSTPGVQCADGEITFPGKLSGKVGEPLNFRYDGSYVCHGQNFQEFSGEINWTGNEHTAMRRAEPEFLGIAGTLKVTFSRPGSYNVHAHFTLHCIDRYYPVGPACNAKGDTVVTIR